MQYQVLLLEDISDVARKGEIIKVKPGFARNYLLPQKKATLVDKRTIRFQERLREERAKQAAEDKKASEKIASDLKGQSFKTVVKVDPDGNMYGSVTAADIAKLLKENGFSVSKKCVILAHPIKTLGNHEVELHLKEGVFVSFQLTVESDIPVAQKKTPEKKEEKQPESEQSEPEEAES